MSSYSVTSWNETISGEQLTDQIITFWHDKNKKVFNWVIKTNDYQMEGEYKIYLRYEVQQTNTLVVDKSASFLLSLKNKLWTYNN